MKNSSLLRKLHKKGVKKSILRKTEVILEYSWSWPKSTVL